MFKTPYVYSNKCKFFVEITDYIILNTKYYIFNITILNLNLASVFGCIFLCVCTPVFFFFFFIHLIL